MGMEGSVGVPGAVRLWELVSLINGWTFICAAHGSSIGINLMCHVRVADPSICEEKR